MPARHPHHEPHPASIPTNRLEAFSDGVFAIVMTLLIFELKVPSLPKGMEDLELLHALMGLWPKLLSWLVSFVVIGVFWVGQHMMLSLVRRTDRTFLWLNLLFLLCVAFIPFPTALMGEYVGTPIAVVPYGLTLIATGLAMALVWWYATRGHRLVSPELDDDFVRDVLRRTLVGPALYAVAILVSLLNARVTLFLYALIPIYYIAPRARFDHHVARHVAEAHRER